MSEQTYDAPTRTGDVRVKVGHLVIGLVFLGLSGTWALSEAGFLGGVSTRLVPALVLLGAGLVGLLAMVAGGLSRRSRVSVATEESPETDDTMTEYDDTTVLKEDPR